MDYKKIGAFIKRLRLENNLSQKELADRIPISREAISKWECGRTIPDSSTIVRLSNIFNVSIDELLFGEYKTKKNKKELEEFHLQIYDERNNIHKKLKISLVIFIILLVIIILFLFQYFLNSYNSVKIYTIATENENIFLSDGIAMTTEDSIYFRLGNINGIDSNSITKISLYYNNGTKKLIYETSSPEDILIKDYYNSNEYFDIENNNVNLDSIYVDIYYDNKVETISLIMNEDYSNKKIFFKKFTNKSSQELTTKVNNEKILKLIKEKYDNETEIIIDNITYKVTYLEGVDFLIITWNYDKYTYKIRYYITVDSADYFITDSSKNTVDECYFDKSTNTCDSSIKKLINSIING
jgi:transcriptional regulator with XRE-family HTH domain